MCVEYYSTTKKNCERSVKLNIKIAEVYQDTITEISHKIIALSVPTPKKEYKYYIILKCIEKKMMR